MLNTVRAIVKEGKMDVVWGNKEDNVYAELLT
jgi:phosphotransferase system IIB component